MALTNGEIQVIMQSNTLTSQLHRDPCFRDHVLTGQVPQSLLNAVTLSSGKHSPMHMKIDQRSLTVDLSVFKVLSSPLPCGTSHLPSPQSSFPTPLLHSIPHLLIPPHNFPCCFGLPTALWLLDCFLLKAVSSPNLQNPVYY